MDVCVRLLCVCATLCVQIAALRRADPPSKDCVKDQETEKAAKVQQRTAEAYIG
jgi:hypothetical protein